MKAGNNGSTEINMQTESAGFTPTAEQLQRDAQLRRFNRLYVYLPLGVISLIVVAFVILLIIGVLSPGIGGTAEFASGMADLIIILTTIPLMLACAIVPAGYFAMVINQRNKRKANPQTGPLAYRNRLQSLFWRLESLIDKSQNVAKNQVTPRVAKPVIRLNAFLTYIETLLNNIRKMIYRRTENDTD